MRLTLDQIEAESAGREPFEVSLDPDTVLSLPHPEDMPFQSLMNFTGSNPGDVLQMLLGVDGFAQLVANPRVTVGVLGSILGSYYKHFGLGELPNGSALPPSSKGTARPSKRTSASPRKVKAS